MHIFFSCLHCYSCVISRKKFDSRVKFLHRACISSLQPFLGLFYCTILTFLLYLLKKPYRKQWERNVHCKKSVDYTVKYLVSGCQFTCRHFYGRHLVEHFKKSRYGRVMLTNNTREYICRIEGLYDPKNFMSLATVLCLVPENVNGRLLK